RAAPLGPPFFAVREGLAPSRRQLQMRILVRPGSRPSTSPACLVLVPPLDCPCLTRLFRRESANMPGLLQRFLPEERGFFDLFDRQAENIHAGAKALLQMLDHYTGVPEQVQSIKAIEHQGDEIAHTVLTKLNQTFITPFDREDLHELCSRLDDVID